MVWISAAFSFADRIGDGHLSFASVVYFYRFCTVLISRVVICRFFFLVICRVHADVYMLGSLIGGFSSYSFPFIICEEKEAVSFLLPSLSDLRAVSMFYCCFSRT